MAIVNYKCPNCDAPLLYSAEKGLWACEHCESEFSLQALEEVYAAKEESAQEDAIDFEPISEDDWRADETEHLRAYSCPQCGAEIITDDTTAATICPYCGNTTIMPKQFTGMHRPDFIIPFKLDKEAAKAALKKHYKNKLLLPKLFSQENQIEKLTGVYVPVWLFDGTAQADISFNGTQVLTRRSGNYRITDTRHYLVRRSGSLRFERVPVDGSSKMDNTLMEAIEPYDYSALEPFRLGYLSGYQADKYDVNAADAQPRAEERIKTSAVDALTETIAGYASLIPTGSHVSASGAVPRHALLPVWMLNTKWHGQNYVFAMNGQTGKLVGDLPIDGGRSAAQFFGAFGLLSVVGTLLVTLLMQLL
ncbi:MAG: hypothetical protein IJP30_04425 [Clostridia bacterium]|nr:hypothetical protein [Clostridia bacterium]